MSQFQTLCWLVSSEMAKQSERTINLSSAEELLWKLLLDCQNHIVYNSHGSTNLVIWFPGG